MALLVHYLVHCKKQNTDCENQTLRYGHIIVQCFWSLMDTNFNFARLLMTPLDLLHCFIYDSTSHYSLSLQ
jgi:hypothetical protein